MTYLLTIRNYTHYFGIHHLREALNRPDHVGLLTVSNHVTTIDSASLPSPLVHFRDLLNPHNCGYWNLAREDQTSETTLKAMIVSLVKIMPVWRGGGVHQVAVTNFIARVKNGEWCHIFPEGRTYQVIPLLLCDVGSAEVLLGRPGQTHTSQRTHRTSWTQSGTHEVGSGTRDLRSDAAGGRYSQHV